MSAQYTNIHIYMQIYARIAHLLDCSFMFVAATFLTVLPC